MYQLERIEVVNPQKLRTPGVAPTSRENIGWWNFETSPVTRRLDIVPNVLMEEVGEALDAVYSMLPWWKSEGDGGS